MEKDYAQKYYSSDETGWWFLARRDMIMRIIEKQKISKNAKILDYGCGGGYIIRFLNKFGYNNVYGIEMSEDAVRYCRQNNLNSVFLESEFSEEDHQNSFDTIIVSDVIEHMEDDKGAVSRWKKMLKPGGCLVVFAPAFNFLWGEHDVRNKHFRRYRAKGLKNILESNEFSITRISYWNFALFFPVFLLALVRKVKNIFKQNKRERKSVAGYLNLSAPWFINIPLYFVLKIENFILDFGLFNFPFGVSVFVVAKAEK